MCSFRRTPNPQSPSRSAVRINSALKLHVQFENHLKNEHSPVGKGARESGMDVTCYMGSVWVGVSAQVSLSSAGSAASERGPLAAGRRGNAAVSPDSPLQKPEPRWSLTDRAQRTALWYELRNAAQARFGQCTVRHILSYGSPCMLFIWRFYPKWLTVD